ncbi:hypothetical protein ACNF5F_25905, partial [Escherichia coli]|uniref:hypothetical protein n=1 Tax=Escherichia coli TaxID=562 RepID=UPI003BA30BE0
PSKQAETNNGHWPKHNRLSVLHIHLQNVDQRSRVPNLEYVLKGTFITCANDNTGTVGIRWNRHGRGGD